MPKTPAEIEAWLTQYLAVELSVPRATVNSRARFAQFGLDSVSATCLMGDLEAWLGRPLSERLPYDYPTIGALAAYLSGNEVLTNDQSNRINGMSTADADRLRREPSQR